MRALIKPFVLLIGLTGFAHGQTAEGSLSAREAHVAANAGRIVLIDVRTPEEWRDTGLPQGAVALDAETPGFEVRLAGLRLDHRGKRIALIDRGGALSSSLRAKLAGRGWRDVVSVRGGMLGPGGWLAEKLPVAAYP
ncbi:MAG TPA: rhodanese-like domain-containing protein [Bosea sp. (in: a-proteobacteria)]|jgi:rhodanese-related sulfurtransferase|uniref:rhodanese-like domain-containing protein n=1 Tax=Bosea sp. (in: a-proteobacteria) TaxID=1871050 RepID=UPI002E0D6231|nr:rhodanese-like domain-containing protein [Bosea sp. (in: a-proteobacteria)]